MPTYTLKNSKTSEMLDVFCTWDELQEKLKDPDLTLQLAVPKIISGVMGGEGKKVSSGFNDLKKRIKANSGKGNTINVD